MLATQLACCSSRLGGGHTKGLLPPREAPMRPRQALAGRLQVACKQAAPRELPPAPSRRPGAPGPQKVRRSVQQAPPLPPGADPQSPQRTLSNIVAGRGRGLCLPTRPVNPAPAAPPAVPPAKQQPEATAAQPLGTPNKALPFFTEPAPGGQLDGLHKPLGLVLGSAYVLTTAIQLSGTAAALSPVWLPLVAGGALGGLYAALNRAAVKRFWHAPEGPLNVVITGGSRGIGKALAREFLRAGDRVFITSRSREGVQAAAAQLREEVGSAVQVDGVECDVSDPRSVERLVATARARLGRVDVWINNAGYSGSYQALLEQQPEQIERVVTTNLLGALLCTRAAALLMAQQASGGHVFNMDGAGADGLPTPQYAAYGATKAGLAQAFRTLQQETAGLPVPVSVHCLSPGMVLTDLLLDGATQRNKQVFNILCDHPETVAAYLVPRVQSAVARGQSGRYIRYLTPARALARFLSAPFCRSRYFDSEGRAVYAEERERLMGAAAKATKRAQRRVARRGAKLALAYSASMALTFMLIAADAAARAPH